MSFSVSRREGGEACFEPEDLNGFLALFDELGDDVLDHEVTVRHHEIKVSLTAFPSGLVRLQFDDRADEYVIEAVSRGVLIRLCWALTQGNVRTLMWERWRRVAARDC